MLHHVGFFFMNWFQQVSALALELLDSTVFYFECNILDFCSF
jgi:hypothetical protein